MIKFALRCEKDHRFESWFASGEDYEKLRASGMLSCAVCGGAKVEKDLMAPRVTTAEAKSTEPMPAAEPSDEAATVKPDVPDLSAPASPAEQAFRELRARIEATTENVGRDFANEARRIHAGDAPDRPIMGEAKIQDAKKLHEEGVPVMPLPWSTRKTN